MTGGQHHARPIVVIGGGAAGLMAAIFAARGGREVVVLERTSDGGRKILISGGGRCNVLPDALQPERFVTDSSPALLRRLLRSWPILGQRAFFESDLRVPLTLEPESRKWFPVSNRARDVRDGLVTAARQAGARFQFSSPVESLSRTSDGWVVQLGNHHLLASRVIVATGGRSVPTTGSDGRGLDMAAAAGHVVHETYPALTPLLASPAVHAHLSGLSLTTRLRARSGRDRSETTGGFLFTHRGYSGPAVLDVSHVAVRGGVNAGRATIRVQWTEANASAWEERLADSHGLIVTALCRHVPQRLGEQIVLEAGIPRDRRLAELRRTERTTLIDRLTSYELPWTGDEGYQKAEVTGGGVALEEVDPRTLESRRQPGLHFCGEILDAFGPIGGHNFAWAWATGRLAGLGAAELPN